MIRREKDKKNDEINNPNSEKEAEEIIDELIEERRKGIKKEGKLILI